MTKRKAPKKGSYEHDPAWYPGCENKKTKFNSSTSSILKMRADNADDGGN